MRKLIIVLFLFLTGCSTTVTRYEYDKHDNAHPVDRIRVRGIGKAKVNDKGYEVTSDPWVKIPSLPEIEFKKD